MTREEILSNNELIAEFMELKSVPDPYGTVIFEQPNRSAQGRPLGYEGLKYNNSFDWLMPVVEKIETRNNFDEPHFWVKNSFHQCEIGFVNNQAFITETGDNKIEAIYKAVVKFVEWYNKQAK